MNVSSLFSGSFYNSNTQSIVSQRQQSQKDFQQLGQDLQTGNLSAASQDFAALQKDMSQVSGSSSQTGNPITQAIQQLNSDLQSGNLSAAQQDYTNLQQDFQNQATQMMQRVHGHHHHQSSGNEKDAIAQILNQLGQDLQSGDVASAQQAYASLQQDLQQSAISGGALNSASSNSFKATA